MRSLHPPKNYIFNSISSYSVFWYRFVTICLPGTRDLYPTGNPASWDAHQLNPWNTSWNTSTGCRNIRWNSSFQIRARDNPQKSTSEILTEKIKLNVVTEKMVSVEIKIINNPNLRILEHICIVIRISSVKILRTKIKWRYEHILFHRTE